ncbi:cation diffusion facilitator family transporter [Aestuariispira ectoiniformans]|uniref:cation diffusion facilitator family transporter n=1 Tax=Aestuariispira ectoiniformans TaxID=2775080 RepID=UPI00223ACD01|nr:cation diffusion facilitator family transporter [Aestuariispira ectoiniformans]
MTHEANSPTNQNSNHRNQKLMRWATYASVTTAVILILIKTWAWYVTSSVALMSSLIDSLMDCFASLVTLTTVAHALTPADKEHRFGHGKAESLGALAQSAFIAASAILLMIEASNRFYSPKPVTSSDVGTAVMIASIIITLCLLGFQQMVLKRTDSVAIKADALHYLGDLLPNIGVIATLWLAGPMGWTYLDPAFALAVSVYLLFNAWRIVREALRVLMDHELPDTDREAIFQRAMSQSQVIAVRDLRTRQAGTTVFIQMDLELSPELSLQVAHDIADCVTKDIQAAYPMAEVMVHQFPKGAHD